MRAVDACHQGQPEPFHSAQRSGSEHARSFSPSRDQCRSWFGPFLCFQPETLECFSSDLEQFVARRWYPVAHRPPGWQESSDYSSYLISAYIQLARTVCQARLLADIGHLQEGEYLRWVAVRDGYSLSAAIEAALILLQGEERRFKEWYEKGLAYLNISIEPDEREHRAVCHLLGLPPPPPEPHDGTKWGTWARAASAPSSPAAGPGDE